MFSLGSSMNVRSFSLSDREDFLLFFKADSDALIDSNSF
jgi:hypothetical protein